MASQDWPIDPLLDNGLVELRGQCDLRQRGSLSITEPQDLLVQTPINAAYRPDGRVIVSSLRARPDGVDPAPDTLKIPNEAAVINDEVLWGGMTTPHYGHFLTETTARLWPLAANQPFTEMPVVFCRLMIEQFGKEWLSAFGARLVDMPEDRTVRFTRMTIPEPSLQLRGWLTPEFRETQLQARRGLGVESVPPRGVVWLSRSRVGFNSRTAYDECLLEWLLRDHVEIVSPETMALADQIALIEASAGVTGILGSAFYTMSMVEKPPPFVGLCLPAIPSTYGDLARLLNCKAKLMLGLERLAEDHRRPAGWEGGLRLLIPKILRDLTKTVLPELAEDPLLAALAQPKMLTARTQHSSAGDLDAAIAKVVLDPHSSTRRIELGHALKAEGLSRLAFEQYAIVAHLADDHVDEALQAARRLDAAGEGEAASPTIMLVLKAYWRET